MFIKYFPSTNRNNHENSAVNAYICKYVKEMPVNKKIHQVPEMTPDFLIPSTICSALVRTIGAVRQRR